MDELNYFYCMQAININTLMDNPLAGCLDLMQESYNVQNFKSSVTLRLALFTSRTVAQGISNQIEKESLACKPIRIVCNEYIVNELLFEYRLAQGKNNLSFENLVLKKWVAKIISSNGADAGLDFLNALKSNREKRKR